MPQLSPREQQVLNLVAEGKSNKQIGLALGIAEGTIKNYVTSIMVKLGALNRAHAVAIMMRKEQAKIRRRLIWRILRFLAGL